MSTSFNPDHVRAIRTGEGKLLSWEYPSTVAHELLHCCNVDHHAHWTGKWVDRGDVTWEILRDGKTLRETVAGEYSSGPPTMDIHLENVMWEGGTEAVSIDRLTQWLRLADGSKRVLYVARQHGEHSGYRDCVMRYDCAHAFIPSRGDNFRYLNKGLGGEGFSSEFSGMGLCDQQEDTAVNEPGWSMPALGRYGSAPRGFCKSQICVNDAKHKDLANKR
jgi:hypothetical protein